MTGERAAQSGERCTCGRQAVIMFMRDNGSEVGYCGLPDGGDRTGSCPFCGGDLRSDPRGFDVVIDGHPEQPLPGGGVRFLPPDTP